MGHAHDPHSILGMTHLQPRWSCSLLCIARGSGSCAPLPLWVPQSPQPPAPLTRHSGGPALCCVERGAQADAPPCPSRSLHAEDVWEARETLHKPEGGGGADKGVTDRATLLRVEGEGPPHTSHTFVCPSHLFMSYTFSGHASHTSMPPNDEGVSRGCCSPTPSPPMHACSHGLTQLSHISPALPPASHSPCFQLAHSLPLND